MRSRWGRARGGSLKGFWSDAVDLLRFSETFMMDFNSVATAWRVQSNISWTKSLLEVDCQLYLSFVKEPETDGGNIGQKV